MSISVIRFFSCKLCLSPILLGLIFSFTFSAPLFARSKDHCAAYHSLSYDDAQSCVAWAKPSAQGALNLLCIAPRQTLGDALALEMRFDCRVDAVALWDAEHTAYDPATATVSLPCATAEAIEERISFLLRKNRYDAMVLGNFHFDVLSDTNQQEIVAAVQAGAGLLMTYHLPGQGPLAQWLDGLESLPVSASLYRGVADLDISSWDQPQHLMQCAESEAGRALQFFYRGDAPQHHFLIPMPETPLNAFSAYEDNAYALIGRALFWLARKEAETFIVDILDRAPKGPDEEEIPPDLLPEFVQSMRDNVVVQPIRPLELLLNQPAPANYRVGIEVRHADSEARFHYSYEKTIPKGAQSWPIDVILGAGDHLVDVWLSRPKGVVDWFSKALPVEAWPSLDELSYSKQFLLPNDLLVIRGTVRKVFSKNRTCTLYARATDAIPCGASQGRRLLAEAYQHLDAEGGSVELRLDLADLMSPLLKVEVFAIEGEHAKTPEWMLYNANRAYRYFSVRLPAAQESLQLLPALGALREYNTRAYLDSLKRLGINYIMAPASQENLFYAAQEQMLLIPELSHYGQSEARNSLERLPCLSDPAYIEAQAAVIQEGIAQHWAGGPSLYSLGKANCLTRSEENLCQSPSCLQGFQHWLKKEYANLYALNRAWASEYSDWEEIGPLSLDAAQAQQRLAPFLDFRRYMDLVFAHFHHTLRSRIQQLDAQARIGFSLLPGYSPYHGYAWDALSGASDYLVAPMDALAVEKLRSFYRPGAPKGIALSPSLAEMDAAFTRWLPWYALLHQIPYLYWDAPLNAPFRPGEAYALQPDARPTAGFQALAQGVAELQAHLAPLLAQATRFDSHIALYESPYSDCLHQITSSTDPSPQQGQARMIGMLEALGYQYRFLHQDQLLSGDLNEARLLILSGVVALSEEERAAISAFCQGGGALLADTLPGRYSQHGVVIQENSLAQLFGVLGGEQTSLIDTAPCLLRVPEQEGAADFSLPALRADSAVRPVQARAGAQSGASSLWFFYQAAQHQALLLNHSLPTPDQLWSAAPVLKEFIDAAGAMPSGLFDPSGKDYLPCEQVTFRFEAAQIFCALPEYDLPKKKAQYTANFNKKDTIYDLSAGVKLSRAHRLRLKIKADTPLAYSRMPYEVRALELQTPESCVAGKRLAYTIRVQAQADALMTHLIRVRLLTPKGDPLAHYEAHLRCEKGYGAAFVPLAKNEMSGFYRLEACDLLTGVKAVEVIKIENI